MSMSTLQGIALALMIAALPLASVGSTQGATWANVAAVAAVGLGGLIPPALRFLRSDDDADDDDADDDDADDDADDSGAADTDGADSDSTQEDS